MNCMPNELGDYVLGELAEQDRRKIETHVRACAACREELDQLRLTQAALRELKDEPIPQRIGFISDKVFEPSALARWWRSFWTSGGRLVFASAAMLSIAVVIAARRPAAPPRPVAQVDRATIEAQISQRVSAEVQKAVAESEARQARKTSELLAAAERRYEQNRKATELRFAEALEVMQKRYNVMLVASNEFGGVK